QPFPPALVKFGRKDQKSLAVWASECRFMESPVILQLGQQFSKQTTLQAAAAIVIVSKHGYQTLQHRIQRTDNGLCGQSMANRVARGTLPACPPAVVGPVLLKRLLWTDDFGGTVRTLKPRI